MKQDGYKDVADLVANNNTNSPMIKPAVQDWRKEATERRNRVPRNEAQKAFEETKEKYSKKHD